MRPQSTSLNSSFGRRPSPFIGHKSHVTQELSTSSQGLKLSQNLKPYDDRSVLFVKFFIRREVSCSYKTFQAYCIHLSVLRYRLFKNSFIDSKNCRGFRETSPWTQFFYKTVKILKRNSNIGPILDPIKSNFNVSWRKL